MGEWKLLLIVLLYRCLKKRALSAANIMNGASPGCDGRLSEISWGSRLGRKWEESRRQGLRRCEAGATRLSQCLIIFDDWAWWEVDVCPHRMRHMQITDAHQFVCHEYCFGFCVMSLH